MPSIRSPFLLSAFNRGTHHLALELWILSLPSLSCGGDHSHCPLLTCPAQHTELTQNLSKPRPDGRAVEVSEVRGEPSPSTHACVSWGSRHLLSLRTRQRPGMPQRLTKSWFTPRENLLRSPLSRLNNSPNCMVARGKKTERIAPSMFPHRVIFGLHNFTAAAQRAPGWARSVRIAPTGLLATLLPTESSVQG